MPRSGTTLIEAVLGAHSRVFACGERPAMRRILRWLIGVEQTAAGGVRAPLQDWAKFYFRDLPEHCAAPITSPTSIRAISRRRA